MKGLYLNQNEINILRQLWTEIEKIEKKVGSNFERCIKCEGTGLAGWEKTLGDNGGVNYSWDGTYCQFCRGKKVSSFYLENLYYTCPKCNGLGKVKNKTCDYCNGKFFVDWIKFLRFVK